MNDFTFYFSIGWQHIITLEALDHILFIIALAAIYTLRDWKQVLVLITAFTVGHTITLFLSARELVTIDTGLVEFLVPCTIAVTAIFNLFQKNFHPKTIRINYLLALVFGLIHGLAFATTLRMILATDQSFALAMASFSAGLETGQILIVFLVLLLTQLVVHIMKVDRQRWVIILSVVVFGLSVQMAAERWPFNNGTQRFSLAAKLPVVANHTALLFGDRQQRPGETAVATLRSTA